MPSGFSGFPVTRKRNDDGDGDDDEFNDDDITHLIKSYNNHIYFYAPVNDKTALALNMTINEVTNKEYGIIPDTENEFIGASPDGICTNCTLDGKFSPLVGRMVEIKCVTTRQLNITGPENMWVKGEKDMAICPHIYWVQMQLQLECCLSLKQTKQTLDAQLLKS